MPTYKKKKEAGNSGQKGNCLGTLYRAAYGPKI